MNQCLIELFESESRLSNLLNGLPTAFNIVKNEAPKGNPVVGLLREHVLTGFLLQDFGERRVTLLNDGVQRGYDLKVCDVPLSIKTSTGLNKVKYLWTVESSQVARELTTVQTHYDMLLAHIHWGKTRESVFYVPLEVQREINESLGMGYFNVARGTNNRGIEISAEAMNLLRNHRNTRRASIDWTRIELPEIATTPYTRWEEFWDTLTSD